jgi:hypothetical protein
MKKLDLWRDPWPLDEAQCPCDVHFTTWLREQGLLGQRIFHFGTGDHHHVGLQAPGAGHSVLGITATEAENSSYIKLIVENPVLGRHYKVLFSDIYQTNLALLPEFDIVTLFHLGEFWSANNAPFATLDDRSLLEGMANKVVKGGHIAFFTGSFAYDVAAKLIPDVLPHRGFVELPRSGSLRIFRR